MHVFTTISNFGIIHNFLTIGFIHRIFRYFRIIEHIGILAFFFKCTFHYFQVHKVPSPGYNVYIGTYPTWRTSPARVQRLPSRR